MEISNPKNAYVQKLQMKAKEAVETEEVQAEETHQDSEPESVETEEVSSEASEYLETFGSRPDLIPPEILDQTEGDNTFNAGEADETSETDLVPPTQADTNIEDLGQQPLEDDGEPSVELDAELTTLIGEADPEIVGSISNIIEEQEAAAEQEIIDDILNPDPDAPTVVSGEGEPDPDAIAENNLRRQILEDRPYLGINDPERRQAFHDRAEQLELHQERLTGLIEENAETDPELAQSYQDSLDQVNNLHQNNNELGQARIDLDNTRSRIEDIRFDIERLTRVFDNPDAEGNFTADPTTGDIIGLIQEGPEVLDRLDNRLERLRTRRDEQRAEVERLQEERQGYRTERQEILAAREILLESQSSRGVVAGAADLVEPESSLGVITAAADLVEPESTLGVSEDINEDEDLTAGVDLEQDITHDGFTFNLTDYNAFEEAGYVDSELGATLAQRHENLQGHEERLLNRIENNQDNPELQASLESSLETIRNLRTNNYQFAEATVDLDAESSFIREARQNIERLEAGEELESLHPVYRGLSGDDLLATLQADLQEARENRRRLRRKLERLETERSDLRTERQGIREER